MPVHYPDRAGEPYRPSNGTEGMIFEEKFCNRCIRQHAEDEDGLCRILGDVMVFNLDDPEYPKEWVYDHSGNPTCDAFDDGRKEKVPPRCARTIDMFEKE
jgi:hypothetical protein